MGFEKKQIKIDPEKTFVTNVTMECPGCKMSPKLATQIGPDNADDQLRIYICKCHGYWLTFEGALTRHKMNPETGLVEFAIVTKKT